MKKLLISCSLLPTLIFGGDDEDCGLKALLNTMADRVYCEAEDSGSKIAEILADYTQRFSKNLDSCTPSAKETETIIHRVAANGTPEMLARLAQTKHFNGYDNEIPEQGNTPIMTSTAYGNVDLVKEFIKQGVDLNKIGTLNRHKATVAQFAEFIPNMYFQGGFAAIGALPIIISKTARYQEITAGDFGPFDECKRLIIAAQQKPKSIPNL